MYEMVTAALKSSSIFEIDACNWLLYTEVKLLESIQS
jgi:hypothetical protein